MAPELEMSVPLVLKAKKDPVNLNFPKSNLLAI